MAAEKSKNAAYERLRKAIKEHSPARAYLFYGEESYLRQTYVQQLQELLIPKGSEDFNLHRLSGGRITTQEVADAVETVPMMAQSTMVTVTDWDIFKLDEAQRRQLIDLLEDLPEYCTVVFIYDTVPYKPDKKMKKRGGGGVSGAVPRCAGALAAKTLSGAGTRHRPAHGGLYALLLRLHDGQFNRRSEQSGRLCQEAAYYHSRH